MAAVIREQRSFLAGRTMGEAVFGERQQTATLLGSHGRWQAAHALTAAGNRPFFEFMQMRERMLAGGYHRTRLRCGRTIDG